MNRGWGETRSSPNLCLWEIRARRSLAPPFMAPTARPNFGRCSPFLDIRVGFKKTARLMAERKENPVMEKIVSLCKRRGFIFQSSEIYGGINGFWDYGPLGAELKRNVKELWWRSMTQQREDVVGLEASIIMHPKIWEASGHASTFSDPMVDCLGCKKRFRADQIEPRSGLVFRYQGAADESSGKFCKEHFSVLVPAGKPPESARKVAKQFYQMRGIENATLLGERADLVDKGDHPARLDGTRDRRRREGGDGEREQHRWVVSLSRARHHPRHDQRERRRQPQPVAAQPHSGAQTR